MPLVVLKRNKEEIALESFEGYEAMKEAYFDEDGEPKAGNPSAATCFLKNGTYWIYHGHQVDDAEYEKHNPGDKLWLIVRHMVSDKDYNCSTGHGFKLDIGDTIKFGRVRYKVILFHNERLGLKAYDVMHRFAQSESTKKYPSVKRKRKVRVPTMVSNRTYGSGPETTDRAASARLPRYQSQATHFEGQNAEHSGSFEENENQSMQRSRISLSESSSGSCSSEPCPESGQNNHPFAGVDGEQWAGEDSDGRQNGSKVPAVYKGYNSVAPFPAGNSESVLQNNFASAGGVKPGLEAAENNEVEIGYQGGNVQSQPDNLYAGNSDVNLYATNKTRAGLVPPGSSNEPYRRPIAQSGLLMPNSLRESQYTGYRMSSMVDLRQVKKEKKRHRRRLQRLLLERKAKMMIGKVCRICLGEENKGVDPLISPCKCAGTMSHIHLECLREWLNSKKTMKEGPSVTTYCWKNLQCELCQVRFPAQVFLDGTIVSDKLRLSAKQRQKLGKPVEILEYDTPDSNFIAIESVTLQNIRIVHVIDLKERSYVKIGRGHDVDIRVTDISVSRYHARISQDQNGDFYVDDNKSKFGTLLQVRQPIPLHRTKTNYF